MGSCQLPVGFTITPAKVITASFVLSMLQWHSNIIPTITKTLEIPVIQPSQCFETMSATDTSEKCINIQFLEHSPVCRVEGNIGIDNPFHNNSIANRVQLSTLQQMAEDAAAGVLRDLGISV